MFWNKKIPQNITNTRVPRIEIKSISEIMQTIMHSGGASAVGYGAAYAYYEHVAPLSDAVNKIASAIAAMELIVIDDDDVNNDYGILGLINNPSPHYGRQQLLQEMAVSAVITGEIWVVLRGRVNRQPVGIDFIRADHVSIVGFDKIESIDTISPRDNRRYSVNNSTGRILSDDGMNELIHVSSRVDQQGFRASCPLNGIALEIEQYNSGAVHNNALLKNGFSPSILLVVKDDAGEDEINAAEAKLRTAQGANNAGGMMMVGGISDKIDLTTNNRDMDYAMLVNNAVTRIYSYFGIPLPLILSENMTLANYEMALEALYDRAIDPVFSVLSQLFERVDKFRYSDGGRVWYNQYKIPALRARAFRTAKQMSEAHAYSIDEIRMMTGHKNADGGDTILAPSILVPIQ